MHGDLPEFQNRAGKEGLYRRIEKAVAAIANTKVEVSGGHNVKHYTRGQFG
jgi:hypothetical protein